MPEAISIGPFLLATRPLGAVLAILLAIYLSGFIARRLRLEVSVALRAAEHTAWIGVAGARLGYAAMNWSAFAEAPWTVLYLWQPGYSLYFGVMSALAFVFWSLRKRILRERLRYLLTLSTAYGIAAIVLVASFLVADTLRDPSVLAAGDRVPDFTLQNLAGEPVSFSSLQSRVVVLNFFASWCPPCRREMPLLEAIHREYADQGVSIIGIDLGEPRALVAEFVSQAEVTYPIWLDGVATAKGHDRTAALFERLGGVGLPTTLFVDTQGVVRKLYVGELNRAILQEQIALLLAQVQSRRSADS